MPKPNTYTINVSLKQVKDRQIQKMLVCEVKNIQYPSCAAVAVGKGMDGLKLEVNQGKFTLLLQGLHHS